MSKELDYLDKILNYQPLTLVERTIIECIKEKIQRLEAIDNAEPSEALKCFENMQYRIASNISTIEYTTIKQALLKAQENTRSEEILQKYYQEGITLDSVRELKQERDNYKKTLETIKEKCVDVFRINYYITSNRINELEEYKRDRNLTEEELELLKEVLE